MNIPHAKPLRVVLGCVYFAALVLCLLEFSGIVPAWQQLQLTQAESRLIASDVASAHALVLRNRTLLAQALQPPGIGAEQLAEIETNIENVTRHWARALPLIRDAEESWLASAVSTQRMQFLQLGLLPALQLLRQEGATQVLGPQVSQALTLYEALEKSMDMLEHYAVERAARTSDAKEGQFRVALMDCGLLAALLLLLTGALRVLSPRLPD